MGESPCTSVHSWRQRGSPSAELWPGGKWAFVGTRPLIFHWEKNTGSRNGEGKSELSDTDPRTLPDQYLKESGRKGNHTPSLPISSARGCLSHLSPISHLLPGFSHPISAAPSSPLIIPLCSSLTSTREESQYRDLVSLFTHVQEAWEEIRIRTADTELHPAQAGPCWWRLL